jgi:D-alanyl-D-alanine carboxypeptidase
VRAAATLVVIVMLLACSPSSAPSPTATPTVAPTATASLQATALPTGTPGLQLGEFPPIPTAELPADIAASLQVILDGAVGDIDAPGIAAALVIADLGTWVGAAGTADGTAPVEASTQFAIGSVTKTITAAQALQLVESGAVDLDRPISEYLDANELDTNGATVRQVLGMRSGIGSPQADPDYCRTRLDESISLSDIRGLPLGDPFFEPGTGFQYLSSNYDLAGMMIEDVTGSSMATVLRSGVLASPGLERLIYQDAEKPTPPIAAPFLAPGSGMVPGPKELLELGGGYLPARCLASSAGPAGSMASDAISLARFGYLLYGGWVLGHEALSAMTDFTNGYYGLGTQDHGIFLGHGGEVPGYSAQLLAFPAEGLAVAVLMNTDGGEADLLIVAGRLRSALRDWR